MKNICVVRYEKHYLMALSDRRSKLNWVADTTLQLKYICFHYPPKSYRILMQFVRNPFGCSTENNSRNSPYMSEIPFQYEGAETHLKIKSKFICYSRCYYLFCWIVSFILKRLIFFLIIKWAWQEGNINPTSHKCSRTVLKQNYLLTLSIRNKIKYRVFF